MKQNHHLNRHNEGRLRSDMSVPVASSPSASPPSSSSTSHVPSEALSSSSSPLSFFRRWNGRSSVNNHQTPQHHQQQPDYSHSQYEHDSDQDGHQGGGGGYYESFTMSSPLHVSQSSSGSGSRNGSGNAGGVGGTDLHHRTARHYRQQEPVTPYQSNGHGSNNNQYHQQQQPDDESPRHRLQRQLPSLGGAGGLSSKGHRTNEHSGSPRGFFGRARVWFWSGTGDMSGGTNFGIGNARRKKKRDSDMLSPDTVRYPPSHHAASFSTFHWVRYLIGTAILMYVAVLFQSTYRLVGQQQFDERSRQWYNPDRPRTQSGRPLEYYITGSGSSSSGFGGIESGMNPIVDLQRRRQHYLFDPKWQQLRSIQVRDTMDKHLSTAVGRRQLSQPNIEVRGVESSGLGEPTSDNPENGNPTKLSKDSPAADITNLDWHDYVPVDFMGRTWNVHHKGGDERNMLNDGTGQATGSTNLHESANDGQRFEKEEIEVATVDQLCGFTAQNASLSRPSSYPSATALNSKSRVMITGILNPIGISLALHLHHTCGVQIITGVDTMFPNTVMNRLLLQERLQLLLTNIPKFVKPVILPFVGLDPKGKSGGSGDNVGDTELQYLQEFEPTHIVHLASYSYDAYSDSTIDPDWKNVQSPYVTPADEIAADGTIESTNFLYPIRSSIVSIQQLLQNILSSSSSRERRPQFIYASSSGIANEGNSLRMQPTDDKDQVQKTLKVLDEILVDSFHHHSNEETDSEASGFKAIGLRLPNTIFGPWALAGSSVHDVFSRSVDQWNLTYTTTIGEGGNVTTLQTGSKVHGNVLPPVSDDTASSMLDIIYVDDTVEAIVAAMQYDAKSPMSIDVPTGIQTSLKSVASLAQSFLETSKSPAKPTLASMDAGAGTGMSSVHTSEIIPSDRTSLKDGILRSLAWHIDRLSPYGPPKVESGDDFLRRHSIETCSADDLTCHKSLTYMPCSSECNIRDQCLPSVFDPVQELVWNVSDGCDIVLYTQSLGYNLDDLDLHAEYMDDKDLDDDELLVCNFAFIPRESDLVSTVSNKVPNEQLAKFGIKPQQGDVNSKVMRERKLDGLNGRLLYRGWILIWIKDGINPLNTPDMSLLKLSPSRFFHPGVQYALFVEENFSVSPNLDDVLFLVDEMKRRRLPQRTLKKEEKIETPHGFVSKKVKLRLPEEPPRRAAILFAPLRLPNIDDPSIRQYRNSNRKLSVYDAAKFMRYEVGYEHREKENASNRRQREYYERIPSYINKNTELRSNAEPWYRYSMRHWVRTRWVLHDFHLEESRQLRCEWYQEHLQWGNDLDQLSFANVMAIRELRRRIGHREPDDHIKSFIEEHPELHDLTDSYEWHDMETETNKLHQEPTNWKSHLPDTEQMQVDSNHLDEEDTDDDRQSHENAPLFVRIMSERVMATSRKLWAKKKKKMAQAKAAEGNNK